VSACGGALPTDERWDDDANGTTDGSTGGATDGSTGSATEPIPDLDCQVDGNAGYHYAEPPEFWLGSQAPFPVAVRGPGYLVTRGENPARPEPHFATQAQLSVSPDGTIEDRAGRALLGYSPQPHASGPCVMPLRAPTFSPPEVTTRVSVVMNLDVRTPVYLLFDLVDPEGTSNVATSFTIVDSLGARHGAGLYFTNWGGNLWPYYVLIEGSEAAGGTAGVDVLVGEGMLQFSADGALETATTPQVCVSFAGGVTPEQCVDLSFGQDIASGGTGFTGSTQFAADTAVFALDANGYTAGTGSAVRVDGAGLVTAEYDSGATLALGTLALARFATEAGLAAQPDATFTATRASGPPQLGHPLSPGRGSVE